MEYLTKKLENGTEIKLRETGMREQEFNLEDIRAFLLYLKKRWLWIVLATVVGFALLFVVSKFGMTEKYTSDVSLYVTNLAETTDSKDADLNNLNAAQKLVDTYIVILQDDDILTQVVQELSVPMTEKQLESTLSMSAVNETEVLKISATTGSPALSAEICNTLAGLAPDVLKRVVKAGSVEVIGAAKPATAPSSPNVQKNAILGAMAGFTLCVGVLLLIFMMDTTVKSEEELRAHFNVPILGEIPDFDDLSTRGKRYGKKK